MKRQTISLSLALLTCVAVLSTADACQRTEPLIIADVIAETPVIVRARAARYAPDSLAVRDDPRANLKTIEFRVYDVLKGDGVPDRIYLGGTLGDRDDLNPDDVPYPMVRPSGRRGMCHTTYYKREAQFLLFLEERDGQYWVVGEALAPVNEQVTGGQDPWVLWVRAFNGGVSYGRAGRP